MRDRESSCGGEPSQAELLVFEVNREAELLSYYTVAGTRFGSVTPYASASV